MFLNSNKPIPANQTMIFFFAQSWQKHLSENVKCPWISKWWISLYLFFNMNKHHLLKLYAEFETCPLSWWRCFIYWQCIFAIWILSSPQEGRNSFLNEHEFPSSKNWMLLAKFGWYWLIGSREDIKNMKFSHQDKLKYLTNVD